MDALDKTAQVYYAQVGALYAYEQDGTGLIQVQAQTVNGNYANIPAATQPFRGNEARPSPFSRRSLPSYRGRGASRRPADPRRHLDLDTAPPRLNNQATGMGKATGR